MSDDPAGTAEAAVVTLALAAGLPLDDARVTTAARTLAAVRERLALLETVELDDAPLATAFDPRW